MSVQHKQRDLIHTVLELVNVFSPDIFLAKPLESLSLRF